MSEPNSGPAKQPASLSWRVPPYQTALLFLVVCGCAALNIYFTPATPLATATIILGVAALALGVAGLRMLLYVDAEGVAVRHIWHESWLPWAEIATVEVASGVRGSDTIRFSRPGAPPVEVPPSLLQPTKPLTRPRALARLKGIAREIEVYRDQARP